MQQNIILQFLLSQVHIMTPQCIHLNNLTIKDFICYSLFLSFSPTEIMDNAQETLYFPQNTGAWISSLADMTNHSILEVPCLSKCKVKQKY